MKNLFKFTLCAFAAAALVNCTNDITDDGSVDNGNQFKTIPLTVEASTDSDESRALFNEDNSLVWDFEGKEQNIAVTELWDDECSGLTTDIAKGDERIRNGVYNGEKTTSTDGQTAVFDVELIDDNGAHNSYSYVAAYPNANLNKFTGTSMEMNLPASQTPAKLGNVDPKATLMFAVDNNGGENYTSHAYKINLRFKHAVGYGRMRLYNLSLYKKEQEISGVFEKLKEDELIDYVTITSNMDGKPLAGGLTFDYTDSEYEVKPLDGNKTQTVTLNVKGLGISADEANTGDGVILYFAALPVEALTDFTVTVVTTMGRTFVKKVSATNSPLWFKRAAINAFKVNFSGVEPEEKTYVRAYRKINYSTELDGNEKECLLVSYGAQHILKNSAFTADDTASSGETIKLDNVSSPNYIYYLGDATYEGKAVDYTYIPTTKTKAGQDSRVASIKSTANEVGYIYIKNNSLAFGNDDTAEEFEWTYSIGNYTNFYVRLFNGSNYLSISDNVSLKSYSSDVSLQLNFFVDEGLRFTSVKFGDSSKDNEEKDEPKSYRLVTTERIPVNMTSSAMTEQNWSKLIVTAKKGDKTYIVRCTDKDTNPYSDTPVTTNGGVPMVEELSNIEYGEAELSTYDDGKGKITIKPTPYLWDVVNNTNTNGGYVFKTPFMANLRPFLYLNGTNPIFDTTDYHYTSFTAEFDSENSGYWLSNGNNYLTIDNGIFSTTTSKADAARFLLYGNEETVKEQEEYESNNEPKYAGYERVTGFEDGEMYFIAASNNYAIKSEYYNTTASYLKAATISSINDTNYKEFAFIAKQSENYWTFQVPDTNQYLVQDGNRTLHLKGSSNNGLWSLNTVPQLVNSVGGGLSISYGYAMYYTSGTLSTVTIYKLIFE